MASTVATPGRPLAARPLQVGLTSSLVTVLVLGLAMGLTLVHLRLAHAASVTDAACTSASYRTDVTTRAGSGRITFACPDAADNDVRTGSGGPGTVTVAAGQSLAITSTGTSVKVDGEKAVQLFVVDGGGSLALTSITVAYGHSGSTGGGLLNDAGGTVAITSSTFYSNASSGSSTSNQGGGVYNAGTATITGSTFSGNSACSLGGLGDSGGGVATAETAALSNTTIAGNAVCPAGTIGIGGDGVAGAAGTMTISNSIVGANTLQTTAAPDNCADPSGTSLTDSGNNLEDDASAPSGPSADCGFSSANQDRLVHTTAALGLGSLGGYGCPTETILLLPGSPAINHANPAVCAALPVNGVDQRGVSRPQGAICDIGAFEGRLPISILRVAGPIFVPPGVRDVTHINEATEFTLSAIASADGVAPVTASYCVVAAGGTCSSCSRARPISTCSTRDAARSRRWATWSPNRTTTTCPRPRWTTHCGTV